MTNAEYAEQARSFLASARHPTLDRPYTELVYQPMLELLDYLPPCPGLKAGTVPHRWRIDEGWRLPGARRRRSNRSGSHRSATSACR